MRDRGSSWQPNYFWIHWPIGGKPYGYLVKTPWTKRGRRKAEIESRQLDRFLCSLFEPDRRWEGNGDD